jgi:tetratricopeptide (TPR) repeat protein
VRKQQFNPWRFDVARNASLALVSEDVDVCLSLDMDEVMLEGWREEVERLWEKGTTDMRYRYVFNWDDEACTIPRITMYNFKIHQRHGHHWIYPVHEIVCAENGVECTVVSDMVLCHHYADGSKLRPYQAMLDQACLDEPENERFSHQRGRELMMYDRHQEAIIELKRHLSLKDSNNQCRALSHRYIARCLKAMGKSNDEILVHMLRSVAESPYQRESWVWLAQIWFDMGNYPQAYGCAVTGLSITNRCDSFESEEGCWGDIPIMLRDKSLVKILEKVT